MQYPLSHKSTEWVSYEQESIFPPNDSQASKQFYHRFAQIQESLYAEVETLKDEKKSLNSEILQLKSRIIDLENQLDAQLDKAQKKDKEISKLNFDKELSKKTEDELKKIIEDLKKKLESLYKENLEHRQNFENYRLEKRDLLKNLKESELNIEEFEKSLRVKDEQIRSLEETVEETRKKEKLQTTSQTLKLKHSKFNIKPLELEKRGISDSPERKNLQLSDRSEEFYRNFYMEARKLFNADSYTQIREKMFKFKDVYLKYKKTQKFIGKLGNMIVQCSPSGSFESEPSTHQIWKWVTRLLEEYMKLKQSVSGDSFNKLCGLLGVGSIDEILEKVIQLQSGRLRGNPRNP